MERSTAMKLTHLGHACLLAETGGARLLFDPGTMSAFDDIRDLDGATVEAVAP
jgi:L-ascorbate metabolism protein UlaG (beta-lactamase superfamily)